MTRVVIVREWLLILSILLGASGIIVGGWAYYLEQLEDEAEELTVVELLAIVERNQSILTDIKTKSSARPLAFDACAGTDLAVAIREGGVPVPKQEFEKRCAEARR